MILLVSPNADEEIITAAYRRLAQKWDPDQNRGDPFAYERMRLLNEAYATLSDSRKRREYDARGRQSEGSSEQQKLRQKKVQEEPMAGQSTRGIVEESAPQANGQHPPRLDWKTLWLTFCIGWTAFTLVYGPRKYIVLAIIFTIFAAMNQFSSWLAGKLGYIPVNPATEGNNPPAPTECPRAKRTRNEDRQIVTPVGSSRIGARPEPSSHNLPANDGRSLPQWLLQGPPLSVLVIVTIGFVVLVVTAGLFC